MFPLSPQSYQIALMKSARITLHRKCFLKDLLIQTNDKKKKKKKKNRQSMAIVNETSFHGNIT